MEANLTVEAVLRLSGPTEESLTFSPSEAIAISGVSSDTLATWYKRDFLPAREFPAQGPGHGKRRRYTLEQIVFLAVARELTELGVSVKDAIDLAGRGRMIATSVFSVLVQNDATLSTVDLAVKIRNEEYPWLLVFRIKGKIEGLLALHELAADHGVISTAGGDNLQDLGNWTRRLRLTSFAVLDWPMVAGHILMRANSLAQKNLK